jgi:flagellar biosynthesis protein
MNEPRMEKKQAVALSYLQNRDEAPRVTAKGEGEIARRIIETAKKYKIPVQEDESLVSMLSQLDLNAMIPPELYAAVAEIFTYIYTIDGQVHHK